MILVAGLVLGLLAVDSPALRGQVLMTQEEALEIAFPDPATVERRTAYLSEEELDEARRFAGDGTEVDRTVVTYYVGRSGGRALGAAYFDAHRVRTMRQVTMVVVGRDDSIERVEVLSFAEPPEYMASDRWIEQLIGRRLTPGLRVGREIVNLTGATLTARSLTDAARRTLALHRVVDPFEETSR